MKAKNEFCTAPFGDTISRDRPPSEGMTAMDDPSIEISFLPTTSSKDGAAVLAASLGGAAP